MSRQATAAAIWVALCVLAAPLQAQSTSARQAVADAKEAYGPAPPKPKCPTVQQGEEIVVCAEEQEQEQFRYSGNEAAKERYARETMDKNAPRAPDVAGPGIFKGPATFGLGKPPPPAYIIDFSELPDTPPGSDADRVGKGLAPTGDDAAATRPAAGPGPTFGGIVTTVPRAPVSPPGSALPEAQPSGSENPPAVPAPE